MDSRRATLVLMAGRRSQQDKIHRYIALITQARKEGNVPNEMQYLKEWVGTAKMVLERDHLALVLYRIYEEYQPNETAVNFVMDTYFAPVEQKEETTHGSVRMV
jgi:hypothetical protein